MKLVLLLAAMLLVASPASAAIRSGSVQDPDDVRNALSPPNMPDVKSVSVSYDEAGSVTVTFGFYEDVRNLPSNVYSVDMTVILGTKPDSLGGCDSTLYGTHNFSADMKTTGYASGEVSGYSGTLTPPSTVSADGLSVSATYTNGALANQGYVCAAPLELVYVYSTPDNIYSHYDAGCDCWYVYSGDDSDTISDFFFAGFEPAPLPACSDHKDNDGDGFYDYPADPDCLSATDDNEGPHPVVQPPPPDPNRLVHCSGTAQYGFFRKLTERRTTCASARSVMREWVKRWRKANRKPASYRVFLKYPQKINVYTCRFKMIQGDSNPYGRITCTSPGGKYVRFYGYS